MRNALVLLVLFLPEWAVAQPLTETLAPKNGKFSIKFPGQAKETTQTSKTAVGELKVYAATYATSDGNVFLVSYTDFPAVAIKPENYGTLFDGVREGFRGKDGKLVSETEITVGPDKLMGREVVIDKGKQQTRFRTFVKDNRLFQVAALGTGEFVTGKDVTAFLDSFEFGK